MSSILTNASAMVALQTLEGINKLRLKFQVQHLKPAGHRMLRWTDETSTSTVRNVA
jgi:hypothetical protein